MPGSRPSLFRLHRTIPDTYRELLGTREERERKREVERIRAQHRLDASLLCTGNREGRRTQQQQRHEHTLSYIYYYTGPYTTLTSRPCRQCDGALLEAHGLSKKGRRTRDIPATSFNQDFADPAPDFRTDRCSQARIVSLQPTFPSDRTRLFVGSTRPPLSVTRRDFFIRMVVVWPSKDRMHASRFIPCVPLREDTYRSPTPALVFRVGVVRVLQCFAPPEDHSIPFCPLLPHYLDCS